MRDIVTTIMFIILLCVVVETNNNITRLNKAEERRIEQNKEMIMFQKDILRLDIRLTRNEIKTEVLKNKEIILMNRDILKKFEKDVEAMEQVIRHHQKRMKK